ncbi:hypothetical protein PHLGIDRAFT_118667 [Phlebiopsis gigantea 11061_1 CR5-6]|uniref:DUF6534 domain-containing protein n=1 Tax=Phlebiopsis gigantea (strain 11061_1 CR5-6) TaxID=745531 RepID=A0A0C3SA89_PHLG1|nr:hypothetical protein PHLGIDRAFT_118667 [Phlebiopsis gigantea 11061_1 CR5-6]
MSNTTSTAHMDTAVLGGSKFLGVLFNWGLYGILTCQVYIYHLSFPRDGWTPKLLVYGTYIVDTAQTIIVSYDAFNTFARHFGDIAFLDVLQNEWMAIPLMTSIVSATVQLYYAYRIGILSESRLLRIAVCVLALTEGLAGVVASVQSYHTGRFTALESKANISTGIWLAGDAVCDITIAALMAYLLLRHDSPVTETHTLIRKLVRLIVQTGALTAVAASVDVILYYAYPHTPYHSCAATVLAKLYSNSLLAIFNSRVKIVGGRDWRASDPAGNLEVSDFTPRRRGDGLGPIVFTRTARTTTTVMTTDSYPSVARVQERSWRETDSDKDHSVEPTSSFKLNTLSEGEAV